MEEGKVGYHTPVFQGSAAEREECSPGARGSNAGNHNNSGVLPW